VINIDILMKYSEIRDLLDGQFVDEDYLADNRELFQKIFTDSITPKSLFSIGFAKDLNVLILDGNYTFADLSLNQNIGDLVRVINIALNLYIQVRQYLNDRDLIASIEILDGVTPEVIKTINNNSIYLSVNMLPDDVIRLMDNLTNDNDLILKRRTILDICKRRLKGAQASEEKDHIQEIRRITLQDRLSLDDKDKFIRSYTILADTHNVVQKKDYSLLIKLFNSCKGEWMLQIGRN
jgi:hypothetical protein